MQTATLDVYTPPDIKMDWTSKDFEVKIGSTANLDCHADGYPDPTISWTREDKRPLRARLPSGEVKTCRFYLVLLASESLPSGTLS